MGEGRLSKGKLSGFSILNGMLSKSWDEIFLRGEGCNTLGVWLPLNRMSFHKHVHYLCHHAIVTETCMCNNFNWVCFMLDCCE